MKRPFSHSFQPQKPSFYRGGYRQPFSPKEIKTLAIALSILGVLLLLFSVTYLLSEKAPVIHSISPNVAKPGEMVQISGKYLKSEMNFDSIFFAGRVISDAYIKEWSSSTIKILVPDLCSSGFVSVKTKLGKSNGILFTNALHIPQQIVKDFSSGYPQIISPDSISGMPGDLVKIKGMRFGATINDSHIFLMHDEKIISLTQLDPLAIEMWSDEEIAFRLPDITFDGQLILSCYQKESQALPCKISLVGATKKYGKEQKFNIQQSLIFEPFSIAKEKIKTTLDFPLPISEDAQTLVKITSSNRYEKLNDRFMRFNILLKRHKLISTVVERNLIISNHSVRFEFKEDQVVSGYDPSSFLYQYYIEKGLIEGDQGKKIVETALSIQKGSKTTLGTARANYHFLLERLSPNPAFKGSLDEALEAKEGAPFHYAAGFVALCRNQSIPARLVRGWYEGEGSWYSHIWSEVYLLGIGWIPIDCWMGDEENYYDNEKIADNKIAGYERFPVNSLEKGDADDLKPSDYYFGAIPANRVIFYRGKDAEKSSYQYYPVKWKLAKERSLVKKELLADNNLNSCYGYFSSPPTSFVIRSVVSTHLQED